MLNVEFLPRHTFNIQHSTFNIRRIARDPPARVAEREVASAIGPRRHAHSPAPRGWVRGGRVAEGFRATRRTIFFSKEQKRGVTPLCCRQPAKAILVVENLCHLCEYCSDLSHKIQLRFLYQSALI